MSCTKPLFPSFLHLSTSTGISPFSSPLPFISPFLHPSIPSPSLHLSTPPFVSFFVFISPLLPSPPLPLQSSNPLLQVSGGLEIFFLSFLAVDILLRLIWLRPLNFVRHKRTVLTVSTHSQTVCPSPLFSSLPSPPLPFPSLP